MNPRKSKKILVAKRKGSEPFKRCKVKKNDDWAFQNDEIFFRRRFFSFDRRVSSSHNSAVGWCCHSISKAQKNHGGGSPPSPQQWRQ